jgi:hypothetical protein
MTHNARLVLVDQAKGLCTYPVSAQKIGSDTKTIQSKRMDGKTCTAHIPEGAWFEIDLKNSSGLEARVIGANGNWDGVQFSLHMDNGTKYTSESSKGLYNPPPVGNGTWKIFFSAN